MAVGQFQSGEERGDRDGLRKEESRKYDYTRPQQLHNCYQPQHTLPISTDECMPPSKTQATLSDLSNDILQQVTLKNQLLMAQVAEYKTLVVQLQHSLRDLAEENYQLKQTAFHQKTSKQALKQKKVSSLKQASTVLERDLPLQLITEETFSNQEFQLLQLHEVWEMLNQHRQVRVGECIDRGLVLAELGNIVGQLWQLQCFVERIWQMKTCIQAGQDDSLGQLWEWLLTLGRNYLALLPFRQVHRKGVIKARPQVDRV